MKEKFKKYLEEHFRNIQPTEAAMAYRKDMLTQLLDREHELRIKGVDGDDLIFSMVIDELGDFDSTLKNFEKEQIKKGELKRKISGASIFAICLTILLTACYLIVGFATHIWHPTWLIMVGGMFVGASVILSYFGIYKSVKSKKYILMRLSIAIIEILASVFVFLLLQLAFHLSGAWLTFLAMVAMIFGVDTALSFVTKSKARWIELPIFVEIFCVMLYVILGIGLSTLNGIGGWWHPGWVLCLGGVIFAIGEIVALVVIKTNKSKKESGTSHTKRVKVDEAYWTKWDD